MVRGTAPPARQWINQGQDQPMPPQHTPTGFDEQHPWHRSQRLQAPLHHRPVELAGRCVPPPPPPRFAPQTAADLQAELQYRGPRPGPPPPPPAHAPRVAGSPSSDGYDPRYMEGAARGGYEEDRRRWPIEERERPFEDRGQVAAALWRPTAREWPERSSGAQDRGMPVAARPGYPGRPSEAPQKLDGQYIAMWRPRKNQHSRADAQGVRPEQTQAFHTDVRYQYGGEAVAGVWVPRRTGC